MCRGVTLPLEISLDAIVNLTLTLTLTLALTPTPTLTLTLTLTWGRLPIRGIPPENPNSGPPR